MTNVYALDGVSPRLPEGNDFWIAPTAALIGDVALDAGTSVWFGAVLRGDNEPLIIGAGSNIQDNCVLHTDMGFPLIIGRNCTIGHRALVHGCSIGNNTLIGMGATILNGAKIGDNCLVGAGALVTEGKEFPDGSLVIGSPARVARTLRDEEIEGLEEPALLYQANMRRYRDGLLPG